MQKANYLTTGEQKKVNIRKLVSMAMLIAIGVVLVAFIEIPIFPAAPFLKYDPADIPILVGTLVFGPIAGFVMTVVVSFIQSFMLHGSGGPIGFVMHLAATGAMVLAVGVIYRWGHNHSGDQKGHSLEEPKSQPSMRRAAIALVVGVITMTAVMVGLNLVLTPIFMSTPVEAVLKILVPVIIPFNLIKAGMNSVAAFLVYRAVEKIIVR